MAKLEIGVLVDLKENVEESLKKVLEVGLCSCQVCSWNPDLWTQQVGENLMEVSARLGVHITTFWSGYPGPAKWNFIEGPSTIGLVPVQYRAMRVEALRKAVDFAARCKLASITTHVGFIPEDPSDANFAGTVEALKQVAGYGAQKGVGFNFETGQETPVTVLRTIERVNTGNLGINLDTANLILYGKGNPVDALDTFGKYVVETHCKDGLFPTNGTELGKEVALGEGKANFPVLVPKLKSMGFGGTLTIEREISGPKQAEDIRNAIALLSPLC